MKYRRLFPVAVAVAVLSSALCWGGTAKAQDPFAAEDEASDVIHLFDSPLPSSTAISSSQAVLPRTGMSVAELRQTRALYRADQRVARIEYNLWMGHEPLRPKWNAIPTMTSRYASRTIHYVPVYYRVR
jgi:hypothetical protein